MADTIENEKVAVGHHSPDGRVQESHPPEKMSAARYAATRFSTLKPPMHKAPNPFRLLAMLSTKQWLFFLVGFFAWVSSLFLLTLFKTDLDRPGMHLTSSLLV